MLVIEARNVHYALPKLMREISIFGVSEDSRNGPVLKFPTPVTVVYEKPTERVLFWEIRDANPFFHFFESLWMLAGRRDVAFLSQFAKQIATYSDNGINFHAAYGYRWRQHFNKDQLNNIIRNLQANPRCRRQVLEIWDVSADLGGTGKDLPCNLTVTFQIGGQGLDMLVLNRSNDAIWGMLGANAVHFSYLLEYMAASIGVAVGRYWQVSSNCHCYKNELFEKCLTLVDHVDEPLRSVKSWSPYSYDVEPFPIFGSSDKSAWDQDLSEFFLMVDRQEPTPPKWRTSFFEHVTYPMWCTHRRYKDKDEGFLQRYKHARLAASYISATDWRRAVEEWLQRRYNNQMSKESGDVTV